MIVAAVFVNLIIVSAQDFECRKSYLLSNGECLPCPDHCETCISNTNCTKNFFGVTCNQTCPRPDCECHKIYGYCTDGCPDGLFPEKDSPYCSACPDNCVLCSSSSACVSCKPRFYGDTCAQRCSTYCETCNKTTGKCIACEEGYFNQDGQCFRCPEGCVGCYDNRNCSGCKSGYLELDGGQCIKHCDMKTNDTFTCLNGQSIRNEDTCGCVADLIDQYVIITRKETCIRYTPCPSTVPCRTCGTLMVYQCNLICRLEKERTCSGESKCNVMEGTIHSMTFCLNTKGAVSIKNIPTRPDCVPGIGPSFGDRWTYVVALTVVSIIGLIAISTSVTGLVRRYRSRTSTARARNKSTNNNMHHATTYLEVANTPLMI